MEKKLSLYIETSLFGFYYDENPRNIDKRDSVRKLFKQIAEGYFKEAFVSSVTIAELARAKEEIRDKLLLLITKYKLKELEVDEVKLEKLAEVYIKEISVFEDYKNDARHVAMATIAGVDVLVTLNCDHIDNLKTIDKVKEINKREGDTKQLDIRGPEEVIYYEG